MPLRADLEAALGLPVVVENDANAAAWGEFAFGAGADVDDLLLLTVGTGVGGGLVIDGQLLPGGLRRRRRGRPPADGAGRSSSAAAATTAASSSTPAAALWSARPGSGLSVDRPSRGRCWSGPGAIAAAITGPMITAAASEGDPFCVELLAELGRWLGEGIASLATVLDPAVTVIGGGVSQAGELLVAPARAAFLGEVIAPEHRPIQEIRTARLGNRAGIIGAADLARR